MDGSRLKQVRQRLGYTQSYVAACSGYTASFISQIERNLREPSLSALRKIAGCLRCSIVSLLVEEEGDGSLSKTLHKRNHGDNIVYAGERRFAILPEINVRYEVVTPPPEGRGKATTKMTGMYVRLTPGAWVAEQAIVHDEFDESIFVLEGAMRIVLDQRSYELHSGDNAYISAGVAHNFMNCGTGNLAVLMHSSASLFA